MTKHYLDAPDALTGGTWQPDAGVQRWVSDPPPVVADMRLLVACPFCRASVAQTCRSSGGNPVLPHSVRLAPRLCQCGELVGWKKQMCAFCAREARRLTYRNRERRQPTSARRKAVA